MSVYYSFVSLDTRKKIKDEYFPQDRSSWMKCKTESTERINDQCEQEFFV